MSDDKTSDDKTEYVVLVMLIAVMGLLVLALILQSMVLANWDQPEAVDYGVISAISAAFLATAGLVGMWFKREGSN